MGEHGCDRLKRWSATRGREQWARWCEARPRTATSSGSIGRSRRASRVARSWSPRRSSASTATSGRSATTLPADGYLAVAPALFDRVERDVEIGYTADDIARGRALREPVSLENALPTWRRPPRRWRAPARSGSSATAGAARSPGSCATRSKTFAAAVGYYGGGVTGLADERRDCPVLAALRRAGPVDPDRGRAQDDRAAHPEVPVFIYPAGHGFNCDQRASYDAESARLARERTLAFFGEHVG